MQKIQLVYAVKQYLYYTISPLDPGMKCQEDVNVIVMMFQKTYNKYQHACTQLYLLETIALKLVNNYKNLLCIL